MKNTNCAGTALLELACLLTILAIVTGLAAAPFATARDVLAVRAARDAIAAASARSRSYAVGHGGADLHIDAASGTLRITTQDRVIDDESSIVSSLAVRLQLEGTQSTSAIIAYDALGIGRIANRTISVHRGRVSGGVTFSSYGRPRLW